MDKTDEFLLLEISDRCTAQDKEQSDISLDQFFKRYGDFCRRIIFTYAREDQLMTEDLYRALVRDVWLNAHGYDDSRNPQSTPENRIKKWLIGRFKGVIRDYWREFRKEGQESLDDYSLETVHFPEPEEKMFDGIDIDSSKLLFAMIKGKVLDERDLDILKTTYHFNGEIPDAIRSSICQKWQISDNTIRTIRYRAKRKIRDFVKKRSLRA
jgi:DNA-directed RNA polymerase specialized sigma24 family protein